MAILTTTRVVLPVAALGAVLSPITAAQSAESPIRFVYHPIDFTLESCETPERHAPETMAGGVGVFDYDNDGDLDIFFANGADIKTLKKTGKKYSNRLFANDGDAHFRDVTSEAGLAGAGFDNGVAIADYDNDGYKDLFVGGVHRSTLYRNNGDGTFTDVTTEAGLAGKDPEHGPMWSVGGAWVDVNNDGLLDLFQANYLNWDAATEPLCEYRDRREYCHPKFYEKLPNQLFLNRGDGTFEDISAASGIRAHPGKSMGVGVADYDLDGLMDLFVTNDKLYNSFFHNLGEGKFEEIAFDASVALRDNAQSISGMGVDFRDLDNNRFPDIFFVALDNETFPFFKNTGDGYFADYTGVSKMAALSLPMAGYSPSIVDLDNDGWKDIFVTCGHVQSLLAAPRITVAQHNAVFHNRKGVQFSAFRGEAGLASQPPSRHRGSGIGDLNGDGLVDVVVSAIGAPAEIWLNESPGGNHWLALALEGATSNRDAIGAEIKLVTSGGTQYSHVSTA
ncbi:MAG: VCBS repeat-containing protein, partial [bacterium]|nr:VCBS repeat-containing protein [bacterium]